MSRMYCIVWQCNVFIDCNRLHATSGVTGGLIHMLNHFGHRALMSPGALFGTLLFISCSLLTANSVHAADLTWGGTYRIEADRIANPDLSSANNTKTYMLHHLVLMPKIVAGDGLTIHSRLDILNNPGFGIENDGTVDSVAGDVIGNGPGRGVGATNNTTDSNAAGNTQRAGTVAVTALYASWVQEFGQLIVGRVPFQFGLGTAFSAGNGMFDHYIDTKDMVAYKIVFGNLSIMPILGKVNEGNVGQEDDVNDYAIEAMYENPETDLQLGVLYQIRVTSYGGNDAPTLAYGGPGATRADSGKSTLIALFAKEKAGDFKIGVEADLLSGDTGIHTAAGNGVSVNAYGIAGEIGYKPENSKTSGMFKLGIATGDDPGSTESYEGYQFNRNYDVALLMFNHPLGQRDFLRTGLVRNTSGTGAGAVSNQIDTEAISNAIYFAPSFQVQAKETLSYGGTFVYALLNKDPIGAGSGTSNNLGWEVDLNLTYKPMERLTWITEAGFLSPGDAWKAGTAGLETKFAYGLTTKAAINF
jgi:hypothetical protein